ncbi:MAG: FAD-binding oxidoreductase, partial [Pseudomonadota bacterium]
MVSVRHWTDRLFSFRVTRPQSLRFRSGEFVMIGLLKPDGRPLLRAYSIASPAWNDELEFYSIKVEDGPLTSRLRRIEPGDHVIVRPKPTGTLVLDALYPQVRAGAPAVLAESETGRLHAAEVTAVATSNQVVLPAANEFAADSLAPFTQVTL